MSSRFCKNRRSQLGKTTKEDLALGIALQADGDVVECVPAAILSMENIYGPWSGDHERT